MTTPFWRKSGHAVAAGALLAFLRLAQVRGGFDPATGLALPSVPGAVLTVCLAFCLIAEPLLQRGASAARVRLADALAPVEGPALPVLICAAMLFLAGGFALAAAGLIQSGRYALVQSIAGILGAASGGGLLLLIRALRREGKPAVNVAALLPSLFFTVFLVLAVYLPAATDPVLARYWLRVLAAALMAFAFSRLAGLVQGEATPRGFLIAANYGVIACLAVLGDRFSSAALALKALYLAGALTLAVFAALVRDDLPAKEPEGEKGRKRGR